MTEQRPLSAISASQTAAVLDNAPVAVYVCAADSWELLYVNRLAQELFFSVPYSQGITCYEAAGFDRDVYKRQVVGLLLVIVGVVHTGIGYAMYFGSMKALRAQTVALFSYIDPVTAILLSALFLNERMGTAQMAGAVLILCAAVAGDMPEKVRR